MSAEMPDPASQPLSETELAILRHIATGATNREIARARGISEATVKKHVTNINKKLGTGTRTEIARQALERGLIELDRPASAVEPGGDVAGQLARELERTRRRTRLIVRWLGVAGVVALAAALSAIWLAKERLPDWPSGPPATARATTTGPRWQLGLSLPTARSGLALVEAGGALYAVGGMGEDGLEADTLRYDPGDYAWLPLAAKPVPVRDMSAVAVQGQIIVPGGCDGSGTAVSVVEAYDISSDTWSAGAPWPAPTCGYGLALMDGDLFVFGGRAGGEPDTVTDAAWAYDPRGREWIALESMPAARSDLAAVVVSDEIHLIGGRDARGEAVTDHWVFRPFAAEPRWDTTGGPRLPEGRSGLAAATVLGRIHVVGGGWSQGQPALVWDPRDDEWTHDPTLLPDLLGPTPWRGAAMAVLDDRILVLAGGTAERGPLDDVRLFEVARPIYVPR